MRTIATKTSSVQSAQPHMHGLRNGTCSDFITINSRHPQLAKQTHLIFPYYLLQKRKRKQTQMSDLVEIIFPLYRLTISGALYDSVVYLSAEGKKVI